MRLHPTSTYSTDGSNLWLATLSSTPSVDELRRTAEKKHRGRVCGQIEGILKPPDGSEVSIVIGSDQELMAYLESPFRPYIFSIQMSQAWAAAV